MKNEYEPKLLEVNSAIQEQEEKAVEVFIPPETKQKANTKGEKNKSSGDKTKETKKQSKNASCKTVNTKEINSTLEELKDDFDIEELAKTVANDNHNKMVHDILNQNNSRISSGKKKSSEKPEKADGKLK